MSNQATIPLGHQTAIQMAQAFIKEYNLDATAQCQLAVIMQRYKRATLQLTEARIRALPEQRWQPIETAPKDGRTLLLGYLNRCDKWRTVRGQWYSDAQITEEWEDSDDGEEGWYETSVEAEDPPNCWRISPTHWMPLPAPPSGVTSISVSGEE